MTWDWRARRGRTLRGPKTKALAAIFKEAQKPYVDPGQHAWIVRACVRELEHVSIGVRGIHDLTSPPEKGQRILIGVAFYSLYDLELLDAVTASSLERPREER